MHGVISGDWGPAGRGLPEIDDGLIRCGSSPSLPCQPAGGRQMSVLLYDILGLGSGPDSLGETRPGDRSIARHPTKVCFLLGILPQLSCTEYMSPGSRTPGMWSDRYPRSSGQAPAINCNQLQSSSGQQVVPLERVSSCGLMSSKNDSGLVIFIRICNLSPWWNTWHDSGIPAGRRAI